MKIINLKKEDKALYRPFSKDVAIVEALYSLSYILKFETKKGVLVIDYGLMPLEILWWADDMSAFTQNRQQKWRWTAMIRHPRVHYPTHVRPGGGKGGHQEEPSCVR